MTSEDKKTIKSIWWDETNNSDDDNELVLPDYLKEFPDLAWEVADNIALAIMGRMCRKGMGWEFPDGMDVDPRMRDAEYDIDKEKEAEKLRDALDNIEATEDYCKRPAYLMIYHKALRDAWAEFEEPEDGTSLEEIPHAHCCLDRAWYYKHSEAAGFFSDYARIWYETLLEFDKRKLAQELPHDVEVELLMIVDDLVQEEPGIAETTVGKFLVEKKKRFDEYQEQERKRKAEEQAKVDIACKKARKEIRKKNKQPGVEVCYQCCKKVKAYKTGFLYDPTLDSDDEDVEFWENGLPLYCSDCLPSDYDPEYYMGGDY